MCMYILKIKKCGKRNNNVSVLKYRILCQDLGGGGGGLLARFKVWQHLIIFQNPLPPHPHDSQGWDFFHRAFEGPSLYPRSQFPWRCLGNLTQTSFLVCAREAGICSQFQESFPSSPRLLSTPQGPVCHPIHLALCSVATGWAWMVAFQPPAAWLHGGVEGTCVVILLPPPHGERREGKRQVRRQKRKDWATACSKIGNSTRECWIWWHPDEMPNYIATCNATCWAQGPSLGTKTKIIWNGSHKSGVLFQILIGVKHMTVHWITPCIFNFFLQN